MIKKKFIQHVTTFCIIAVLGILAAGSIDSDTTTSSDKNTSNVSKEKLEILESKMINDSYSSYIVGKIKNNTDKKLHYVVVSFAIYDANDVQVGNAVDSIFDLEAGGFWKFKAPVVGENVKKYKLSEIKGQ